VVLDVVFGGLVRMTRGDLRMSMRDKSLMRRVSVIVLLVVFGRLPVMPRGQLVMFGRGKMVFVARKHFRHGVLRCDRC
jgi:hypothetical protein